MEDLSTDVQTEEKIVNFLDVSQQKHDWRYETYNMLKPNMSKTIYWIATVFLSEVSEKEDWYLLRYFKSDRLIPHGERRRDVDSALLEGKKNYLFNLSEFKGEMMKAKHEGYLFYSIFVEEYVNSFGVHHVDGLYSNREVPMYGIASYTPWYKMPVDEFLPFSHFRLNDEVVHVALLENSAYNWLK